MTTTTHQASWWWLCNNTSRLFVYTRRDEKSPINSFKKIRRESNKQTSNQKETELFFKFSFLSSLNKERRQSQCGPSRVQSWWPSRHIFLITKAVESLRILCLWRWIPVVTTIFRQPLHQINRFRKKKTVAEKPTIIRIDNDKTGRKPNETSWWVIKL